MMLRTNGVADRPVRIWIAFWACLNQTAWLLIANIYRHADVEFHAVAIRQTLSYDLVGRFLIMLAKKCSDLIGCRKRLATKARSADVFNGLRSHRLPRAIESNKQYCACSSNTERRHTYQNVRAPGHLIRFPLVASAGRIPHVLA